MKRSTQIALVGLVLLALAALSSVKRASAPKSSGDKLGACCPLIQTLNQLSLTTGTDAPVGAVPTNQQPATNRL